MYKLAKFFSGIFLFVFIFLVSYNYSYANTLVFNDSFDTNANKWEIFGSNGWTIVSGEYGIFLNPGISNSLPKNDFWNYEWKNIVYEVDLRGVSGTDKNILVKYIDSINFVEIHHTTDGHLELAQRRVGIAPPLILDLESYPLINGVTYHFKILINGNNIKVFIDDSDNPILEGNDIVQPETDWRIGLRAGTGAVSPTEVWFDNIKVTDLDTTILTVPDLKQGDDTWGGVIYNNYPDTANSETIRKWGCYLTSAAMLLQKNDFNVNPLDLNNILKNNGGFDDEHGIDLAAVAAYTSSFPGKHLEYKNHQFDTDTLDSELEAGRPPIIKLQGATLPYGTHFIVVTGKDSDGEYLINDPEPTSTKTKLSEYPSELYNHIRTLVPSESDFSYMNIFTSLNVTPKVFTSEGVEITGFSYIEGPIAADDGSNQTAGEAQNVFSYPKPAHDNYVVHLEGSGLYQADIRLYDLQGEFLNKKFEGLLSNSQIDELSVEINEDNSLPAVQITIDSALADLEAANISGYISNQKIYKLIKTDLLLAQYFQTKNRPFLYKASLKAALYHIELFTPRFITNEASKILKGDIEALLL